MEFKKIVQALEDALFQIAWWIAKLPFMFGQYFTKLSVLVRYVGIELEKKKEEQFKNLISPITFLILVLILPFACWKGIFPSETKIKFTGRAAFIGVATLCFLLPTSFAQVFYSKKRMTKANFYKAFMQQCYIQPPILLVLIILVMTRSHQPQWISHSVLGISLQKIFEWLTFLSYMYFVVTETKFIFTEPDPDGKFSNQMGRFGWVLAAITLAVIAFTICAQPLINLMSE